MCKNPEVPVGFESKAVRGNDSKATTLTTGPTTITLFSFVDFIFLFEWQLPLYLKIDITVAQFLSDENVPVIKKFNEIS